MAPTSYPPARLNNGAGWQHRCFCPLLPCSLGLSATSEQYFFLRTNQPPAISQQYFSLKTNQHQPSATSKTNRLCVLLIRATLIELDANVNAYRPGMNIFSSCTVLVKLSTEIPMPHYCSRSKGLLQKKFNFGKDVGLKSHFGNRYRFLLVMGKAPVTNQVLQMSQER
jgi:hypothetical protein